MVNFGLIGCGRISLRHIRSLAACQDARLTAVCDVNPVRTVQAISEYRQLSGADWPIREYTAATDLLADSEVQAVVVATHSGLHADLAEAALNAGKHVMLEKPMALSLADADRIIRAADVHAKVLQICHQLRYRTAFRRLKEAVDAGRLGNLHMGVVSIRLHRSTAYYEEARWRGSWLEDGGMLLNQGIHLIDLLAWYFGKPRYVYGALFRPVRLKQTEDVAAAIVHFDSGIGVIEANTVTLPDNLDNCLTLFGEKGTVSIGGVRLDQIRRWSVQDADAEAPDGSAINDEHLEMYVNFIQAIEGKKAMLVSGRDGKAALELIFSVYDSHRNGHRRTGIPTDFNTSYMSALEEWL
jgi:predicted dehydrogenase